MTETTPSKHFELPSEILAEVEKYSSVLEAADKLRRLAMKLLFLTLLLCLISLLLSVALAVMLTTTAHAQTLVNPIEVKPPLIVKPLPGPPNPRQIWLAPPAQNTPVKQHRTLSLIQRRILPPPEYDHEYKGTMTVTRVANQAAVQAACALASPTLGCAKIYRYTDACDVFIAADEVLEAYGLSYDVVFRHERAHCNGFRHDESGKTVKNDASKPPSIMDMGSPLLELGQRRLQEQQD